MVVYFLIFFVVNFLVMKCLSLRKRVIIGKVVIIVLVIRCCCGIFDEFNDVMLCVSVNFDGLFRSMSVRRNLFQVIMKM